MYLLGVHYDVFSSRIASLCGPMQCVNVSHIAFAEPSPNTHTRTLLHGKTMRVRTLCIYSMLCGMLHIAHISINIMLTVSRFHYKFKFFDSASCDGI